MADWQDGGGGLTLALRRSLAGFEARLFLSACIVVSLLPLPGVRELDGLFLVVFGLEFLVRAAVVFRGEGEGEDHGERGWRWPTRGALLLLCLDLLALVSFLPLAAHDTPWMRLLRVIRLVALLSYWAPVMQDLRVVAEVVDAELCARLRRRARLHGDDRVQVYALESLRAAFLFQSVLVPAFNLVYGESGSSAGAATGRWWSTWRGARATAGGSTWARWWRSGCWRRIRPRQSGATASTGRSRRPISTP